MLCGFKGANGGVEHCTLLNSQSLVEPTLVPNDGEGKFVVSEVLLVLIGIAPSHLGRPKQREADVIVGRLVPSVLTVIDNGNAIIAAFVREVCPLVRIYLVFEILVVAAFYIAQSQIVGGIRIADIEREVAFEQRVERFPFNLVVEVDAVSQLSLIQTYVL